MIRIIVVSNLSGAKEDVYFLDDGESAFNSPAEEFCETGQTVDIDEKMDIELPSGFPLGMKLSLQSP